MWREEKTVTKRGIQVLCISTDSTNLYRHCTIRKQIDREGEGREGEGGREGGRKRKDGVLGGRGKGGREGERER